MVSIERKTQHITCDGVGLTVYAEHCGLVTLKVGLSVGEWVHRLGKLSGSALVLSTICLLGTFTILYAPGGSL